MSVIDNLTKIKSCKEDIKQAIIEKGVDMTDVAFTEYAVKISEIPTGGGGGDYLDFRANATTYYSTAVIVDDYVFYKCTSLQSVNLPNCIGVGSNAFQYCSSLQSVNLPNCISVGGTAFNTCSRLTSINLPNCISVGNATFQYCTSLQSINLPNCESVSYYGLYNCSSLQSVNLPVCGYIDGYVFAYCSSLSTLDLRSTYSCTLGNIDAFSNTPFASGIGSIYIHKTVLSQFQSATNWTYYSKCFVGIGDATRPLLSFSDGMIYGDTGVIYSNFTTFLGVDKNSVISIDLPNCVGVGREVFINCYSLTSIDLPNCVNIGSSAFTYCSRLTSVNLPNCLSVGSYAFRYCYSLTSVNLPNCSYVGNDVFGFCSSLTSIDLPNCVNIGSGVFTSCIKITSVNLPFCSYVGAYAFQYCSSLTSVNLPFCSRVEQNAFVICSSLTSLYIGTSISTVCVAIGDLGINTNKCSIFVPLSLVEAYKSANYWSKYASQFVGI